MILPNIAAGTSTVSITVSYTHLANRKHFNEEVDNVCEALGELVRERYADEIAEAALNANKRFCLLYTSTCSETFCLPACNITFGFCCLGF